MNMKFLKNDVVLLLGFLLLFCFGLSFLRNDQAESSFSVECFESEVEVESDVEVVARGVYERNQYQKVRRVGQLADLSTKQLMEYMGPLFLTKSSSAIISFLKHIPSASVYRIVESIIKDRTIHLPPRVKVRIIFGGAERQCSRESKYKFFDLLVGDALLKKGAKPVLVKAVEAGYSHIVPDLLHWARRSNVGDIEMESLVYAARHDDEDPEALREIFEAGVTINRGRSSKILAEIVQSCEKGYSIPFLVQGLSANPNHVVDDYTVLMYSVKEHKMEIVFELLRCGANPNFKVSNKKTALELAREIDDKQIQEVIKNFSSSCA